MRRITALFLALLMTCSLAACGQKNDTKDDANSDTKELTYAVEAGSAGEAAAAEKGCKGSDGGGRRHRRRRDH